MHLKGGKKSRPWYTPPGSEPWQDPPGPRGWGREAEGKGGGGEPPARGPGGALPSSPATHGGRRGGLRIPLTYLQDNKDDI